MSKVTINATTAKKLESASSALLKSLYPWPIQNDGTLCFSEKEERFEMPDTKYMVALSWAIQNCINGVKGFGFVDYRCSKSDESTDKDKAFVEEFPTFLPFHDKERAAIVLDRFALNANLAKIDYNYFFHIRRKTYRDDPARAHLIFIFSTIGIKVGLGVPCKIYVKLHFELTGQGLTLFLDSFHR